MPVKAGYLLLAGGGAVVVWSGIKGKAVTGVFRGLIGGQNPASLPEQYGVGGVTPVAPGNPGSTPTSAGSGSGNTTANQPGTGSGPSGAANAGVGETAWITAFLANVGALPTPANVSSVANWIAHEKPPGNWSQWNNPLNIGTPGSVSAGRIGTYPVGPGIAEYATPTDGAYADAQFILSNGYNQILMLLRAGKGLKSGAESDLSRWSGGGYSSV